MQRINIILAHLNTVSSQNFANIFAFHPQYKLIGEAKNLKELEVLLVEKCDMIICDSNSKNLSSAIINNNLSTPTFLLNFNQPTNAINKHNPQDVHLNFLLSNTHSIIASNQKLPINQNLENLKSIKIKLTEKETQMINMLIAEQDICQIAEALNITRRSAENMRIRLKQKTNSKTLFGLMRFAIQNNITHLETA
jgi:DNA-binding NarL/FixJ family response regulator